MTRFGSTIITSLLPSKRSCGSVGFAVCCLIVALRTTLAAQTVEDVVVDDSRPLAAAVKEFEKRCRCVVTYEDVKWSRDQVAASSLGRRRSDGAPTMIPRGIPFRFEVEPNLSQLGSPEILRNLRLLMDAFENSQNPGRFKLLEGQTAYHVIPARSAVLERPISVNIGDTSVSLALQAWINEVSRVSGEKVSLELAPWNSLSRPVHMVGSNEPAYEVLRRILDGVDHTLSWRLLYDINVNTYFLTIYRPR